jgi:hypothetical protein
MRRSFQLALLASLAVAYAFWSSREEPAAAPKPRPRPVARRVAAEVPEPATIARMTFAEPRTRSSSRNLFAYVTAPVAPVVRKHVDPRPVVIAQPAPVMLTAAPVAEAPRFPYRYIGRFGRGGNEIAAFARDGEVVTAKRGDRVAGFEVRAIGIESVDLVAEAGVQRIALASR